MLQIAQAQLRNRLLRSLRPEDYALLRDGLESRPVASGYSITKPFARIEHIYFPESGIASVTTSAGIHHMEVGVIGREGFVGLPVVLDVESCPHDIFVQMPGLFTRITTEEFRDALEISPPLRRMCLRFVQTYLVQTSFTAMANARFSVEHRLARWLLMCHDRGEDDELPVTHDFLAMMLGCRRPGVTVATHLLEGEGMIRAKRGRITVRDRAKLIALAGESYGCPEAEYERLLVGEDLEPPTGIDEAPRRLGLH